MIWQIYLAIIWFIDTLLYNIPIIINDRPIYGFNNEENETIYGVLVGSMFAIVIILATRNTLWNLLFGFSFGMFFHL